jgi:acyl-CoA synthetase (AMP-forming)/AMP-acid ligase II
MLEIVEGPALKDVPLVTVPEFVRERARAHPDKAALVEASSGRSYTYGELDRLVGRCAAGLAAYGFKPGDTLLMFAPNLPEWAIVALGAMAAGGVVSGANPAYNATDLAWQIEDAGASFVFTIPALLKTVREGAGQNPCKIILFGEAPDTLGFDALIACQDPEPKIKLDPDALAALPYSSGTTGLAKGVVLTHRTLVSNVCQYLESQKLADTNVSLIVLPMYHIFGFTVCTLCGLAAGTTSVTMPRFEPEPFLNAIEKYRVTHLAVVPPLLQFLAMHPMVDNYDLSSLELVGCGAAPLGEAMEARARERLNCAVVQGFGMTESSGVISTTPRDNARTGSSGQLLPGTQARIVDPETGADLSRGATGEFWFRGPQAFKGYLNKPDATAGTLTSDGWVRTGDIGHFDADGFLYITDRLKELIKVKAFQVAPAELEALLLTHPGVADVAVIGRPDERSGEIPVAYVVARGALDPDELKSWVAERVVEYKQLHDVIVIEAIPKSPSGKILRRILRTLDAQR